MAPLSNNTSVACWLLAASGVLGGCTSQPGEPPPAASTAATKSTSAASNAPGATAGASTASAAPSVAAIPSGAPTAPFTVVASPAAKDVPGAPVTGSSNGRVFEVKRIEITATATEWWITLIGPSRTPTVRWDHDSEYVRIRFGYSENGPRAYESSALAQRVFRKQLGVDDPAISLSFNTVDPADPASTLSHTGDGAVYLEFTSWTVKPWRNDQKHQIAGVASGKLYLGLASSGGIEASGVAGEFKDAPISRTLLQP